MQGIILEVSLVMYFNIASSCSSALPKQLTVRKRTAAPCRT